MHDLLIIGSGPAGVSAALCAKARDLDILWLGNKDLSPKIGRAERIMNYPGLPAVTGREMRDVFLRQTAEAGIALTEARIDSIYDMGGYYVACANDRMFEGQALLLATGVASGREVPGESRLLGRGVSYCATCDGMLYQGKRIAVVLTSPQLEHEAEYLAELAEEVLLFAPYKGCGIDLTNVTMMGGILAAVEGEHRVEAVRSSNGTAHPVDGVFFLRDSVDPAALLQGLEMDGPHIRVDRQQRTDLPGCFAAGDCTGRPYQYAKAVGEGNVAVHSAIDYLHEKKRANTR